MDTILNLSDASKALDLANIRFQLIRLEDTITFYLIERAQFPLNHTIYESGGVQIPNSKLSLFDWMLREQERLQSLVRRYESPDEYPFFPDAIQQPILQPLNYPQILHPNDVDVNQAIKEKYIETVLPSICKQVGGDIRGESQENYGSTATCDVLCLQALSRRVHFGKFVAESKFQSERERFIALVQEKDRAGIQDAIMNQKVQNQVLDRLRLKARTYGTDPSNGVESETKIDVEAVVAMYEVSGLYGTDIKSHRVAADTIRKR
ncbi:chorismate mutase aro7 [Lecanora helva]